MGGGRGAMSGDPERYATAEQLAQELRTTASGVTRERMVRCLAVSSDEADHAVGIRHVTELEGSPVAASVVLARAVEWWKANDSAFGVIGFADTGALRAPRDGFGRHADALLPIGRAYGVA